MTPTLAQIVKGLLHSINRFPRKKLGQHFLVDPLVLSRIIEAAELKPDDTVIEIGSGLGLLTFEAAQLVQKVIAVEIDRELLKLSKEVLKDCGNVQYVGEDILKYDWKLEFGNTKYKIIGNLPYYITAPIVEKILLADPKPEIAVIMVQKEVGERMAAGPGTKKFGSFSIFVQYYAEVKLNSLVSKSSFHPWPEVSSAVITLRPHATPKYLVKDEKRFFDIVHAAFQQRRKKLRNSLAKFNLPDSPLMAKRPEQLSIEEFAAL